MDFAVMLMAFRSFAVGDGINQKYGGWFSRELQRVLGEITLQRQFGYSNNGGILTGCC